MEEQIKNYHFNVYNIPLKFCNITVYKKIRNKYVKEESCKVYLYSLEVYSMNRHWRHGEGLDELCWLNGAQPLDEDDQHVFKQFASYCMNPIAFLDTNKSYHKDTYDGYTSGMNDYWCFEHLDIVSCFEDFLNVSKHKTNLSNFDVYLLKLEKSWLTTFYPEPSTKELISHGFLVYSPYPK